MKVELIQQTRSSHILRLSTEKQTAEILFSYHLAVAVSNPFIEDGRPYILEPRHIKYKTMKMHIAQWLDNYKKFTPSKRDADEVAGFVQLLLSAIPPPQPIK